MFKHIPSSFHSRVAAGKLLYSLSEGNFRHLLLLFQLFILVLSPKGGRYVSEYLNYALIPYYLLLCACAYHSLTGFSFSLMVAKFSLWVIVFHIRPMFLSFISSQQRLKKEEQWPLQITFTKILVSFSHFTLFSCSYSFSPSILSHYLIQSTLSVTPLKSSKSHAKY